MEDLKKIDQKYRNFTRSATEMLPVSVTDEQKRLKVDDLNFVDEDVFVVETQKNNAFVFTHQDGDDEESKAQIAGEIAGLAEEAQGLFSMEELMAKDFESLLHGKAAQGQCGLQNLGNTCFMNSGLQCLSNVPELTKYFLMGYHMKEYNADNPLGMKGKLAKAFGSLIREMWCGKQGRTAPHDLKRTLGSRISRFSGYGQQDSAELVNYLLDLIHEDLNRVKQKPYVEMSEVPGRPEHVVAKEYWDGFQARNASIIVDLMYGQLKSTVTCLSCGKVANAYDPYLSVCLPIVKEEKLEFNYVQALSHRTIINNEDEQESTKQQAEDGENDDENKELEEQKVSYELNPLSVIEVTISKSTRVIDIKNAVISQMELKDVCPEELVVCNQKSGKITELFSPQSSCYEIDQDRQYTMVYHVPGRSESTKTVELNFHNLKKRGKRNFTVEFVDKSCPRLCAFTIETTIMDVKRHILSKMRGIFEKAPTNDEELNEMLEVHVSENLPLIKKGKYHRQKAECEFCDQRHGHNDDYCELELGDTKANETVESAQNTTIGQIFEKMNIKRRLILAVVLKSSGERFDFNQLRCKYRKFMQEGDMTIEGRAKKSLNLNACFAGLSAEEVLSGDDQWYCNVCKEHRDITKKLQIYSVPKILILQLKRFQQRRGASSGRSGMFGHMYAQIAGQEKNDAFVDYPVEGLDMRPYAQTLANEPEPVYYDLIGVSNHFGSLNGGHYTACCKNPVTGRWSNFNDSSVSGCSATQMVSPAAYLLWYRKRD